MVATPRVQKDLMVNTSFSQQSPVEESYVHTPAGSNADIYVQAKKRRRIKRNNVISSALVRFRLFCWCWFFCWFS